jgi:hypothetical protein
VERLAYIATITWTKVRGANIITKVLANTCLSSCHLSSHEVTYGELPTIPMTPSCNSVMRILMATARAAVVNVIFMNLKS